MSHSYLQANPSIFELERPIFKEASKYLENVEVLNHTFTTENQVVQLTPEQFVNGFSFVHCDPDTPIVQASVQLPSIKDVAAYTGHQIEGLVFRFMLMGSHINKVSIRPGTGDEEYTSARTTGRLDYYTLGPRNLGKEDDRAIELDQFAQFVVRLSEYKSERGPAMDMYLVGAGNNETKFKTQKPKETKGEHTANKSGNK